MLTPLTLTKLSAPPAAYYLDGDDVYLRDKAVAFFKSLVPEEYRAFNLRIIEGNVAAELEGAANTISMFPSEYVIIVRADDVKGEGDLNSIADTVEASKDKYILFLSSSYLNARIKKASWKIDAKKPDIYEVKRACPKLFPDGIDRAASDLLVEYTGGDMAKISLERDKLLSYAGNRKISLQDIRELVPDTAEYKVFEFSGAIAAGNGREAMEILKKLLEAGESKSGILASLVLQYRRMLHSALSNKTDPELAELLGCKPYAITKARELASKFTKARLKACLDSLKEAEFSFKSGKSSEDAAFGLAISKMINYK
jgi:DNA polymerase III, delta subunit